ncbi:flagellin N-methylase [Senna tora]|uniref:Flagellin N-methylase n=1 Tax=Senna tora TaxID=362788 RepID=A0A834WPM8_9FABA|nr:flagellin N-methylase [Senna tora]
MQSSGAQRSSTVRPLMNITASATTSVAIFLAKAMELTRSRVTLVNILSMFSVISRTASLNSSLFELHLFHFINPEKASPPPSTVALVISIADILTRSLVFSSVIYFSGSSPKAYTSDFCIGTPVDGNHGNNFNLYWSLIKMEKKISLTLLTFEESLIGLYGWCEHFEKSTRKCSIYAGRPYFCRVEADVFKSLYGIGKKQIQQGGLRFQSVFSSDVFTDLITVGFSFNFVSLFNYCYLLLRFYDLETDRDDWKTGLSKGTRRIQKVENDEKLRHPKGQDR